MSRTANSLPHVTSAQSVQPSASGRPASEGDQLPGPSFTATLPSTTAAYRAPSACSISTCIQGSDSGDIGCVPLCCNVTEIDVENIPT